MNGYLLDSNILVYWSDVARPEHTNVNACVKALPDSTPLFVSAVTLGEIEYGRCASSGMRTSNQDHFEQWLAHNVPCIVGVDRTTALHYGRLRACLFDKYAPKAKRTKALRPEQLIDPVTSQTLGIHENDLWIAAQAFEHNLVLVTHDKMQRIRSIADDRFQLLLEDWAQPPEHGA